jgi:hypothetical protein
MKTRNVVIHDGSSAFMDALEADRPDLLKTEQHGRTQGAACE